MSLTNFRYDGGTKVGSIQPGANLAEYCTAEDLNRISDKFNEIVAEVNNFSDAAGIEEMVSGYVKEALSSSVVTRTNSNYSQFICYNWSN